MERRASVRTRGKLRSLYAPTNQVHCNGIHDKWGVTLVTWKYEIALIIFVFISIIIHFTHHLILGTVNYCNRFSRGHSSGKLGQHICPLSPTLFSGLVSDTAICGSAGVHSLGILSPWLELHVLQLANIGPEQPINCQVSFDLLTSFTRPLLFLPNTGKDAQ